MRLKIQKMLSSLPLMFNRKSAVVAGWAVAALVATLFAADAMLYLSDDSEDMEHVSAVIRNYFLIVAGVAAFIFTAIRVRQTDEQISQANDQIRIAKSEAEGRAEERLAATFQSAVVMLHGATDESKAFAISQIRTIGLNHMDEYLEQGMSLLCAFAGQTLPAVNAVVGASSQVSPSAKEIELGKQCIDAVVYMGESYEAQSGKVAPIRLQNTNLKGQFFVNLTFEAASLSGSDLKRTVFLKCTFIGNFGTEVDFDGAFIGQSKFLHARFHKTNFAGTNLIGCTFDESSWHRCDFGAGKILTPQICRKKGAMFNTCNLSNMEFSDDDDDDDAVEMPPSTRDFLASDFRSCTVDSLEAASSISFDKNSTPLSVSTHEYSSRILLVIAEEEATPHNN